MLRKSLQMPNFLTKICSMLNIYFKHYISIKNNYIILISIKVKSPLNELMLFHYAFLYRKFV